MSRSLRLVLGALAAVLAAGWLALVEVFWLPLRLAGVLVPLSVPAAAAVNYLLVTGVHRLTGSRAVAVLPALTWLAIALAATVRRPEGDLVAVGVGGLGAVTLAFLGLGVVGAAVALGRVLVPVGPHAPAGAQR